MVQSIIKTLVKFVVQLVVWVLILSINWDGITLFDYLHEIIVENPVVETLDQELSDVWSHLRNIAGNVLENREKIDSTRKL